MLKSDIPNTKLVNSTIHFQTGTGLDPFNDDIHTGLAWFFERSVSRLAKRMSKLPEIVLGSFDS